MIQLDKTKLYAISTPANIPKEKPSMSELENMGIDKAIKWRSDDDVADDSKGVIFKSIAGAQLKGRRVRVKASETTIFTGNPRLSEPSLKFDANKMTVDVDVSDLEPLMLESGGNAQPVDGRLVNGKIEIIAGLRRRQACLNPKYWLTVDLYENVTDEQAVYIAETENSGRKDCTLISDCRYMRKRFDELKYLTPTLTVESFATMYSSKRRNMVNYLAIGRLPDWLVSLVKNNKTWSLRQAIKVHEVYKDLSNKLGEDLIKSKIHSQVPSAAALLAQLKAIGGVSEDSPTVNEVSDSKGNKFKLKMDSKGFITIKSLNQLTEDQFVALQKIISST